MEELAEVDRQAFDDQNMNLKWLSAKSGTSAPAQSAVTSQRPPGMGGLGSAARAASDGGYGWFLLQGLAAFFGADGADEGG